MLTVNEYFDAQVKSIGYEGVMGTTSMGVMASGSYTFGTNAPETMLVVDGQLTIKLPDQDEWQTFSSGEQFEVPGSSSFDVKVEQTTAYLCRYN